MVNVLTELSEFSYYDSLSLPRILGYWCFLSVALPTAYRGHWQRSVQALLDRFRPRISQSQNDLPNYDWNSLKIVYMGFVDYICHVGPGFLLFST